MYLEACHDERDSDELFSCSFVTFIQEVRELAHAKAVQLLGCENFSSFVPLSKGTIFQRCC